MAFAKGGKPLTWNIDFNGTESADRVRSYKQVRIVQDGDMFMFIISAAGHEIVLMSCIVHIYSHGLTIKGYEYNGETNVYRLVEANCRPSKT